VDIQAGGVLASRLFPGFSSSSAIFPSLNTSTSTLAPIVEFSVELRSLSEHYRDAPASLGDVVDALGVWASGMVTIICALPFLNPIPLPGLSTPFGVVILLLACRFFLGLPPWLPKWLRAVELPGAFMSRLLAVSSRLVGWLEPHLPKRLTTLVDHPIKLRVHVAVVIASALLLMLPLPPVPPLTNALPASVVIVMTFSALKHDGIGILAGYALFAVALGYFVFWAGVLQAVLAEMVVRRAVI
jgi:hypothetical protein